MYQHRRQMDVDCHWCLSWDDLSPAQLLCQHYKVSFLQRLVLPRSGYGQISRTNLLFNPLVDQNGTSNIPIAFAIVTEETLSTMVIIRPWPKLRWPCRLTTHTAVTLLVSNCTVTCSVACTRIPLVYTNNSVKNFPKSMTYCSRLVTANILFPLLR